ncbi:MAG: NADH-quinone oxidoreductase subunit N [Bacteroidales bacterium]|nr:NADH-quinone oxidoreductase subunit N [Bacteroidales bacterium]
MTATDILCLVPVLPLAVGPLIIMIMVAIKRNYELTYGITLLALLLGFAFIFYTIPFVPHSIGPLFVIDHFSLFFLGIIILSALLIVLISYGFIKKLSGFKEEYYIILLTATLGAALLAMANDFVSFFLGLETLSISLYVLISFQKRKRLSVEAGVKYLILAAASSAFLLFGMGLVYVRFGTMQFDQLAAQLIYPVHLSPLLLLGFGMMLVGLGFKLALVPFHAWTPDVYQGAPTPVSAYIATVSKGGVMAVFIRFFFAVHGYQNHVFFIIISAIAILTMLLGNFLAIRQKNLKRLLGYSSITNMGFIIVILLIGNKQGVQASIFYLLIYFISTIGAFGVLSVLSTEDKMVETMKDVKGLYWRKPWLAAAMTFSMLSLAGLPLTAGFIAKFYLIFEAVKADILFLVFVMLASSIISLYYYLRVVTAMFSKTGEEEKTYPALSFSGGLALSFISVVILFLGVYPGWLIEMLIKFVGL